MNQHKRDEFGEKPLGSLLLQQAVPASVGILVMSIYGVVDTIFVGLWVGSLGIGAITVILPVTFLIGSVGMAIGVGGASIISRAFGRKDDVTARRTFGNQVLLTGFLGIIFISGGYFFLDEIVALFGGRGEIEPLAAEYFLIVLLGVPFLAIAMMCNNVIRAEGYPRTAMLTLIIPAVVNIILDPILIVYFEMGIAGAAWATAISYMASSAYAVFFFVFGDSKLKLKVSDLKPDFLLIREILSLGSVTFARQGTISFLSIVLNNSLFIYGGETGLSIYGIINRVMFLANFPVLGITQGFLPIAGYNFGAKKPERIRKLIRIAVGSATGIALVIFSIIMLGAPWFVQWFTNEQELIDATVPALRIVFLATPLIAVNLIGSAFFQSAGRAFPALVLAVSKQGLLLIPLILVLPLSLGINGIWIAFPLADTGAAIITGIYYKMKFKETIQNPEPDAKPLPQD
ncbi:MAG: MATE family efflux transporter [Balneolales bacterium]|nr:MATE family efflux transporter [Balneolales bacterium]